MLLSDYINIALCILSFVLAVISVITVVITLRQNNKMIESSTRPYVVIYSRVANFSLPSYYIVLKNTGQSGATIIALTTDVDLVEYSYSQKNRPFEHIADTFIAPGQSIICNINYREISKKNIHKIIFKLTYKSSIKEYDEKYVINFDADIDNIQTRISTDGKELRTISYTLQDLVEKLL